MQTASTSFRHFNDESPLGLRRILSQSTDSLNMRNRTLSVESLIDEGKHAWCEENWARWGGAQDEWLGEQLKKVMGEGI
jgi:hypothetical protein